MRCLKNVTTVRVMEIYKHHDCYIFKRESEANHTHTHTHTHTHSHSHTHTHIHSTYLHTHIPTYIQHPFAPTLTIPFPEQIHIIFDIYHTSRATRVTRRYKPHNQHHLLSSSYSSLSLSPPPSPFRLPLLLFCRTSSKKVRRSTLNGMRRSCSTTLCRPSV